MIEDKEIVHNNCNTRKILMQSIKDAGKVCMVQEEKTNTKTQLAIDRNAFKFRGDNS